MRLASFQEIIFYLLFFQKYLEYLNNSWRFKINFVPLQRNPKVGRRWCYTTSLRVQNNLIVNDKISIFQIRIEI